MWKVNIFENYITKEFIFELIVKAKKYWLAKEVSIIITWPKSVLAFETISMKAAARNGKQVNWSFLKGGFLTLILMDLVCLYLVE